MLYAFNEANAADRHETQYFEMFGNRGIYHKGWSAVTKHRTPWVMVGGVLPAFDDDVCELYDGSTDYSQAHDLAAEQSQLARTQNNLRGARARLVALRGRLAHDRRVLAAQLVARYETPEPDLISVLFSARGFADLLEKVDDLTVKVLFDKPTPFWADAFVGTNGMIIPKHLFADYIGGKSREIDGIVAKFFRLKAAR